MLSFLLLLLSHRACLLVRSLACLVACGGGGSVCHLCVSCFACLGCAARSAQGTVEGNGCFLLPLFRTGLACSFARLLAWWLAGGVGACAIFASAALPAWDVPLEARKAQWKETAAMHSFLLNLCFARHNASLIQMHGQAVGGKGVARARTFNTLRWHTGRGFDSFRRFESMPCTKMAHR